MEALLKRLADKGMPAELHEGLNEGKNQFDKAIHFPEVNKSGMSLLIKIRRNKITLYQRIGMDGYAINLGKIHKITDDTLDLLKIEYDNMKKSIVVMNEFF